MNDTGEGRAGSSHPGAGPGKDLRWPQAASVAHRWWENPGAAQPGSASPPAAKPVMPAPGLWPPPPSAAAPAPAALPVPPAPAAESALVLADRQRMEMELEAAHAEVAALHEMLQDLPEIFERKFRQRVQGLVEEQQRLMNDNQLLRDRLYALTPATPTAPRALRGETQIRLGGLPINLPSSLRNALDGLRGRPRATKVSSRPGAGRTKAA